MFRSKEEELERLTQEISEIKSSIKEISVAAGRIERHVKRSFGIPPKPKNPNQTTSTVEKKKKPKEEATITAEQALSIFDELSLSFSGENPQEVENQ